MTPPIHVGLAQHHKNGPGRDLSHIRTLCSTCHKLNESCCYVHVFQYRGVYGASAS